MDAIGLVRLLFARLVPTRAVIVLRIECASIGARTTSKKRIANKPPRCAYLLSSEELIKQTIKSAHKAKERQTDRSFSFATNRSDTKILKYLATKYFLHKFAEN